MLFIKDESNREVIYSIQKGNSSNLLAINVGAARKSFRCESIVTKQSYLHKRK